ncbi:hypothetical protein SNEBB_009681, partial [Seison nebaliae]
KKTWHQIEESKINRMMVKLQVENVENGICQITSTDHEQREQDSSDVMARLVFVDDDGREHSIEVICPFKLKDMAMKKTEMEKTSKSNELKENDGEKLGCSAKRNPNNCRTLCKIYPWNSINLESMCNDHISVENDLHNMPINPSELELSEPMPSSILSKYKELTRTADVFILFQMFINYLKANPLHGDPIAKSANLKYSNSIDIVSDEAGIIDSSQLNCQQITEPENSMDTVRLLDHGRYIEVKIPNKIHRLSSKYNNDGDVDDCEQTSRINIRFVEKQTQEETNSTSKKLDIKKKKKNQKAFWKFSAFRRRTILVLIGIKKKSSSRNSSRMQEECRTAVEYSQLKFTKYINQILNGIATLSNHIKELDNKTSKANEEILQLKKKIESNELKREPNNGECNHEMPKWNETDCKKITSIFEHWESEYPNLKFHFPTDLENWAFKQDPSKCNIFPYMSNGIWRICIISIDDSQIFTINPFFESDEELNDFMMNVVPLKRYKIVNIARESSKNTDNSLIIVIKFLDKLLSNDESLTSILNGWKRNRSVKKIQQQIDDMDKSEIKIYETYIESLINQPLLTKESVTTRTKTDVTETPNPNDENVPIIVGNLDPPKLIKECDLLEWNNELTNYFFNNQIPNQLQLKIAIAALDRDSRAKVVMAQKYNFLILRDRNELISYLFKQSKGVDIGVCFRGMTRHHDESPSHFMQRLDNLYSAAFPDSPEERRNHEIGEQFIAGIDNEQMSRILLSIPNRTIPKLLQTVEEREKVNISINEIKTRGLMNKASVNQLKHADGVHRTNNEFTRKKQKFAIKECKFCKSNKCKIHDRSCSYCWKGNCRKHITFQKNYDSPKFERNEVNVIKTTNKHDLMCINVIINQHNIVALIDSGSTISLLHERWCKKLEINQFPTNTKLVSFTGTEVNATGNAIICVEIDNRRLTQNFTISNDINYDAIIGYDFLKKFKLSIDAANGLLYWEDEINEINSVDTSFEQIGDLKVIENEDIRKEVTKILTNPPKNVLRTEHKIDVETQSSISCQTRPKNQKHRIESSIQHGKTSRTKQLNHNHQLTKNKNSTNF